MIGANAAELDAEDMRFLLYTSGTTGKPKGIMHTQAGYMVYTYLKQYIVSQGVSPGALPPIFLNVRRQIAASDRSVFVIGNDNADGMGSALANLTDLAVFDIATGRGHIFRDWIYEGLNNASAAFGFRLGVADGEEDANLGGRRIKNAGVLYLAD